MKYSKPEITLSESAVVAIQSLGKIGNPPDSGPQDKQTVNAYEADE